MKCLLILAAAIAVALARPELYKEQEDFQYSRSSSDDGDKSGYYGARRGNMGGNFEKAHNMDYLAQNQMSSLVKHVEGELGDASNTRTGSVYTSANSQGVYGSGKYDLSNLQGRNFQESTNYDESRNLAASSLRNANYNAQSSSSLHSQGSVNSAHNSRYQATQNLGLASNSLTADNLHQASGAYGSHRSGYEAKSGYDSQSGYAYGQGSNAQTRLVGVGAPARVVIRPGSTIVIPVAAQTYESSHSAHDMNAINTETEVLNNHAQHINIRPVPDAKRYESSYNYRKQWEKHDTVPGAAPLLIPIIPTVNPLPVNSELYEDALSHASENHYHASDLNAQSAHSSNVYAGYNANSQSALTSQSKHQSSYDAGLATGSNAYTNGVYNTNAGLNSANLVAEAKPKSYQSSYAYHKSWERQGDPYVIYPAVDAQTSARLTDSSNLHSSHQYGSHQHSQQSYGHSVDCDENGHLRVARSPQYQAQETQQLQDFSQQSQNLEDLGQQTQQLQEFGQHSQNLEDLGQQTQQLQDFGQQSQNLEDLGQQTQQLQSFGQHSQNLEDLGQQTQQLQDFSQQSQAFEDLGQQTQDLKYYGQQSQKPDKTVMENNIEALHKPVSNHLIQEIGQNKEHFESQNVNQQSEDLSQQTQNQWNYGNLGQQSQNTWGDYYEQNTQHEDKFITQGNIQQNDYRYMNQQTQGMLNNSNTQDRTEISNHNNGKPLNTFWNKFNGFMQSSSVNTNQDKLTLHGPWNQSHHTENHFQFNKTDSSGYGAHQSNDQGATSSTGYAQAMTTSTFKPENLKPRHSGRGDIDWEDPEPLLPTQKTVKTPEEIETLSLTKETVETTTKINLNHQSTNEQGQRQFNVYRQNGNSDNVNYHQQQNQAHQFNIGQQSHNSEDLGQQTQQLQDFEQQSQNSHYFGQETQQLQSFGQQSQAFEDLNQQTQQLQAFGQRSQNLDLGQQTQQLQDFGQQSQNLEEFGQQTQQLQNSAQQSQNLQGYGQQTQHLQSFGQQSQNFGHSDMQQNTQELGQLNIQQAQRPNIQTNHTGINSNPYESDKFYENRYNSINVERSNNANHDNHDNNVIPVKEPVEKLEVVPLHKETPESTTIPPTSPVKPGFWKSMGNKVSSWFKKD